MGGFGGFVGFLGFFFFFFLLNTDTIRLLEMILFFLWCVSVCGRGLY